MKERKKERMKEQKKNRILQAEGVWNRIALQGLDLCLCFGLGIFRQSRSCGIDRCFLENADVGKSDPRTSNEQEWTEEGGDDFEGGWGLVEASNPLVLQCLLHSSVGNEPKIIPLNRKIYKEINTKRSKSDEKRKGHQRKKKEIYR